MNEYQTTRIWKSTLKVLRYIRAETSESIVAIIDRLARQEWQRLQKKAEKGGKE
jgi:hypothetical protein